MSKTNLDGFESRFEIPGINTNLAVIILPRKFMHSKFGKQVGLKKGENLNGLFDVDSATIYIVKELSIQIKESTLLHEVSHMLDYYTRHMNEEDRCDIIGAYMMRLYKDKSFKKAIKEIIHNKRLK